MLTTSSGVYSRSAYAIGAKTAYVYIRGEYVTAIRRMEQAIAEAHEKGYLGTGILGSNRIGAY
ncbi:hypothetical protein ACCS72_38180, partial [Rhizobium ruizarguesonis]